MLHVSHMFYMYTYKGLMPNCICYTSHIYMFYMDTYKDLMPHCICYTSQAYSYMYTPKGLPNQELSMLYGRPTLNYGGQLSPYVPYMLRVSMTGDLANLQLSDLQGETRPICRTSDLQGERMLICRTQWPFSLWK